MRYLIKVKARAAREIHRAAKWWAENRIAAPGLIEIELDAAFKLIVEFPEIGNRIEGTKDPKTRRVLLDRTKYCVYYRPRGKYLETLAFWHSARGRGPKV